MISGQGEFKPAVITAVISDLMCTLFNPGVPEVAVQVWANHLKLPESALSEALAAHEAEAGLGKMSGKRVLIEEWMRSVLMQAGRASTSDQKARNYAHKLGVITAKYGQSYPLTHQLIRVIRQSGRRFGILSTVSPRGRLAAKNLGFDEPWVDAVVFSSDVGRSKEDHPDEVYQIACGRLDTNPANCMFVDDHIDYLRAGKRLGITAVAVLHAEGCTARMIDAGQIRRKEIENEGIICIDTIAELGSLLQLTNWPPQTTTVV